MKVGQTTLINNVKYKTYELFRVSDADHNVENFTTSINAYSVDTTSMRTDVISGATSLRPDHSGTWS